MSFNDINLSLCVGDIELVSIPNQLLESINFPDSLEDIKKVVIDFGDCYVKYDIKIEISFFSHHNVITINGNDLCYKRLFEFLDEMNPVEQISVAVFESFQFSFSLMQKLSHGFARLTPDKPVIQSYKNGMLDVLEFMMIDYCYTITDYTQFRQWQKPRTLYFNEDRTIKEQYSCICFEDHRRNKKMENIRVDEYIRIMNALIGQKLKLNYQTYEFEFENYTLNSVDELIIDMYFYFDDYRTNKEITFNNRDYLFHLTHDERTVLQMQVI